MPVPPTNPGVHIEEIPGGVRTIVGVATSITAFIGRAKRGPVNEATVINSFGDFERIFGGLDLDSTMSYAVRDFYLNGGSQAVIVRLYHPFFAGDDERSAAKAIADALSAKARAAVNGKAAKDALEAVVDTIDVDAAKSPVEKRAATDFLREINALTDDAEPAAIAEVADAAVVAAVPVTTAILAIGEITLAAASPGKWGANLRAVIDRNVSQEVAARMGLPSADDLFNLTVNDTAPGGATERFLNLSLAPGPRRVDKVLKEESQLVRLDGDLDRPPLPALPEMDADFKTRGDDVTEAEKVLSRAGEGTDKDAIKAAETALTTAKSNRDKSISNGSRLTKVVDFTPPDAETGKLGLFALEQVFAKDGLFNILCIPPYDPDNDVEVELVSEAAAYCEKRRAMLLVDPRHNWNSQTAVRDAFNGETDEVGTRSRNAALFFPRLSKPNPLRDNQMEDFVPCGTVAGIFARTDAQRGVWKAPAGLDAALIDVPKLSVPLTDDENGELNPLGINCLRSFPVYGHVVWGARTLRGADRLADEYKYIPVRRTALFIEESLFRGLKWAVFEPNDEPLWAQIRLSVGAFMQNMFQQGAFQGRTPREAYFVKCDSETTTQSDINLGIVNVLVGFAPLKPSEFVVIKLRQIAGHIDA
ncbi:MAG TPA: phage tail sheath subtilisin-like domain-containing protein [Pyrinomonadaceae bacterium]|nr:phage tail sheath subtilisin-like domain-containing protein [Pyrinomonadaceae bacterium]